MYECNRMKSDEIWILKGMAILSVVSAHVAYDTVEIRTRQIAINLLSIFGTVGVILFLLLSGYLFISKDERAAVFWKKKLIRLVPVWVFCSTLVYLRCFQLYNVKNWTLWYNENIKMFSFEEYLRFILGCNSLYYFMPILFCCFFVFRIVRKNDLMLVLTTAVLLIMLLFRVGSEWFPSRYLNPFGWLGYFGIGCCYRKFVEEKYKNRSGDTGGGWKIFFLLINMLILLVMAYLGIGMNYWHDFFFPFVMLQVFACCIVSSSVVRKTKWLKKILIHLGKDSLYIYLSHMLLQSVPVKYLYGFGIIGILMRPIMLIAIVEILIYIIAFCGRYICTIASYRFVHEGK